VGIVARAPNTRKPFAGGDELGTRGDSGKKSVQHRDGHTAHGQASTLKKIAKLGDFVIGKPGPEQTRRSHCVARIGHNRVSLKEAVVSVNRLFASMSSFSFVANALFRARTP
jgi:hypothetical protein